MPPGIGYGSSTAATFGCPGTGGSIGLADPGAHLGFGYTMNQTQPGMPVDPRALRIIDALYASLWPRERSLPRRLTNRGGHALHFVSGCRWCGCRA
jgi:CubicO group peptidase (beta-lactamase class C family)